jgi:hypothetical protein
VPTALDNGPWRYFCRLVIPVTRTLIRHFSIGGVCFGAIAAGDMATLRAHTVDVAALQRHPGGNCEEPGWLWWSGVALASDEVRYRSALGLAGAADAVARRDGLQLHEQLRRLFSRGWNEPRRRWARPTRNSPVSKVRSCHPTS